MPRVFVDPYARLGQTQGTPRMALEGFPNTLDGVGSLLKAEEPYRGFIGLAKMGNLGYLRAVCPSLGEGLSTLGGCQ
jgi:hypothetical protein